MLKEIVKIELHYKQLSWTVQKQPFYSHPFSKISPENTGGRVLL